MTDDDGDDATDEIDETAIESEGEDEVEGHLFGSVTGLRPKLISPGGIAGSTVYGGGTSSANLVPPDEVLRRMPGRDFQRRPPTN